MELMFRFVYDNGKTNKSVGIKCIYAHTEADARHQFFEWAAESNVKGQIIEMEPGTSVFDDNRFG